MPGAVQLTDLQWVVIETADGQRWIALTPEQYEAYRLNNAETFRWMREAGEQLRHYRGEGQ